MTRGIVATALAVAFAVSAIPASADPTLGVSFTIGAHPRNDEARCLNPVRAFEYGAQVADALTAGAAAEHGGVSRTPFGTSPALAYVAEQGALDLIVGALTRRWSCGSKNAVNAAIGASALSNAVQNGATSR